MSEAVIGRLVSLEPQLGPGQVHGEREAGQDEKDGDEYGNGWWERGPAPGNVFSHYGMSDRDGTISEHFTRFPASAMTWGPSPILLSVGTPDRLEALCHTRGLHMSVHARRVAVLVLAGASMTGLLAQTAPPPPAQGQTPAPAAPGQEPGGRGRINAPGPRPAATRNTPGRSRRRT